MVPRTLPKGWSGLTSPRIGPCNTKPIGPRRLLLGLEIPVGAGVRFIAPAHPVTAQTPSGVRTWPSVSHRRHLFRP